jgi:enoyl-CoA hydratase/carnithine racemase
MPFDVTAKDGVLTLTLDTPGSAINIFNHATAHQLIDILSNVTPATTRAIVFETAKPNSFINGVGLLLAQASQTYDDIMRASTPPWTAYRAVREAPVPTIAVVQGSCFGCGVEFALNCDYRIATDSYETQFYMTELNDYLFIPLFGSTWNLPAAVGLADAINLLLWGQRWGAEKAGQRGLIDEVVPHGDLAERTQRFVQGVLEGTQPSHRRGRVDWGTVEDRIMERARRRVQSLPAQYHQVYGDALDLLDAGARQTRTYVDHQQQELKCSAASALSPIGKSAYAFFYLRQMASERAAGRLRGTAAPVRLCLGLEHTEEGHAFACTLRARKLSGVTFDNGDAADFRLVEGARDASARCGDVAVRLSLIAGPSTDVEIYAPTYRAGGRLVELATRPEGPAGLRKEEVARLTRTLQRFGFEIACTTPADTFVCNRLLIAYFAPLVGFVERYGHVDIVNAELRNAGFVQRPHDLLAAIDHRLLVLQLASALSRPPSEIEPLVAALKSANCSAASADTVIIDALCVSLLDAVLTARARCEVRDTSILDLIARELLDFPRHLCSLCTWLKTARVARAVDGDPRIRSLVTETALDAARAFAVEGRELYR